MIKVLSIGTDRRLFEAGSGIRERLKAQAAYFEELHVLVFSRKDAGFQAEQVAPNFWIYPTNSRSKFFYISDGIKLGRKIIAERKLGRADSVVTVQDPFESGLCGFLISRKAGLPIQVQLHTDFLNPDFRKSSLLNRLRVIVGRAILPKASQVRVVSKRIADSIKENRLPLESELKILPVFVETDKLRRLDTAERVSRFQSDPVLLCVGRLEPEKDFSLAIRVFGKVLKKHPAAVLVFAGEGREKEELKKLAESLGLSGKVFFEGWQNDLANFYKSADILLVTSRFEGFGLVLAEAALAGLPIVSTHVGITDELLLPNYGKLICDINDEDCLANSILYLADNPDFRLKYMQDLKAKALDLFPAKKDYFRQYAENLEACIRPR